MALALLLMMKKASFTVFIIFLALVELSLPVFEKEAHRKIASISLWPEGNSMNSYRDYAPSANILAELQKATQDSSGQAMLQQANMYADVFYLSSMNYLAGLESLRAGYGITTPLFSTPNVSVAKFNKDLYEAQSNSWTTPQIYKNMPKKYQHSYMQSTAFSSAGASPHVKNEGSPNANPPKKLAADPAVATKNAHLAKTKAQAALTTAPSAK